MHVQHIAKSCYGRQVLADIQLDVAPGEMIWIEAAQGAGKSLLANILMSVESPDRGEVLWQGTSRRRFGAIFDTPALISNLSIGQNIALVMDHILGPATTQARREDIGQMLKDWQLDGSYDLRPVALSRGQAMRVALMRALIGSPHVLIWDDAFEAFGGRDFDFALARIAQARQAHPISCIFLSRRKVLSLGQDCRSLQLSEGRLAA